MSDSPEQTRHGFEAGVEEVLEHLNALADPYATVAARHAWSLKALRAFDTARLGGPEGRRELVEKVERTLRPWMDAERSERATRAVLSVVADHLGMDALRESDD